MKPHPQTCEVCPYRYRKIRCPAWITAEHGFIETHTGTGEQRVVVGCFYQVIPKLMAHIVGAAQGPQVAFEDLRNKVAKGFRVIATRQVIDHLEKKLEKKQGLITDG